jgi:molybdate transport system substrate-binding protein
VKVWAIRSLCALMLVAGCAAGASENPGTGAGPDATTVRIAAAADLRFAMDALVAEWDAADPLITVEPTYGSSGNFFAQISEGAPFDVLFSADAEYPRALEEAGVAASGSTRLYAIGQIVVWVPLGSPLDIESHGIEELADPSARAVAIANPEHAPYGRAAVAAMRAAGVYDAVEPRLVLGENVSQAAQFVESGNADAGVIALSLALAPPLVEEGRYVIVPIDSYPRIEQGAVVLDAAVDPDAAHAFLDFVLGPRGRAVLDRYGFMPPP